MTDYGLIWNRNDSLFALIGSRLLALLITAAVSLYMGIRRAPSDMSLIQGILITLAALFLLSPTVCPWYLTWTVPFLCFVRSPGWLLLTGLVSLFYVIPIYGESAIRLIEYLPVYLLLVLAILPARLRFWERLSVGQGRS